MKIRARFHVGSRVRLSDDGRENDTYQNQPWFNKVMIVTHVATKYMPAREFFANGKPEGYHPGFDECCGDALYDLECEDGTAIHNSLYDYELRYAL